MRTQTFLFTASLLSCLALAAPPAAKAQSDTGAAAPEPADQGGGTQTPETHDLPTPSQMTMPEGWWNSVIDVGVRATGADGWDRGWFERYRDLRSSPFANVRFVRDTDDYSAQVVVNNAGYRDQRYYAEYWRPGRMRAYFEWDQIPLFFSQFTRTPFSQNGNGTLSLSPVARQAAQAGAPPASVYLPLEQPIETRSRRDTVRFGLRYALTQALDARASFSSYSRQGNQPWSMSFGFGEAVEVPLPVDQRQTDISTGLDWGDANHMLRVAYDGSWFTNNVQSFDSSPSLTIDNPLRFTNAVNNPAQGRQALPPDNNSQTVTGAAMTKLPGRSQLSANVALGRWRQNDNLLPITINTALPAVSPDRPTADLDVRRVSTFLSLNSRPSDAFFFDARYRLYDFSNQSPIYNVTQVALYDQALSPEDNPTLWSHRRQNLDLTGTYTAWRQASVSVGYVMERNNQNDRLFAITNEHGVRASIDTTTLGRLTLHGIYEHTRRSGSDADVTVLTGAGDPPNLQRYDIANRTRDQVTAMAQVMATDALALTASIAASRNDYTDATFGLQHANSHAYTVGLDLLPGGQISAGIAYGLEQYSALEASHQTSNPPADFTSTALNWSSDEGSTVNYVTANLNLLRLVPNTEIIVGYDFNRSNDQYTYTVGPALPRPAQWTPVIYEWQELHADARYFLTRRAAVGASYWASRMRVNDFAFGPPIIDNPIQPGGMLLGYGARPFTGNVGWFRFEYFF